jgi:hypothetical protein
LYSFELLRRVELHELDLDAARVLLEERHPALGVHVAPLDLAGGALLEGRAVRLRLGQRRVDVVDRVADVVQALAAAFADPLGEAAVGSIDCEIWYSTPPSQNSATRLRDFSKRVTVTDGSTPSSFL